LVTAIAFNLFYSHCLFQQFMLAPILHALKTHITHILNQLATNRNGFPTEMDSLIMSRFLDQMLFDQQVFKPRVIVEEPGRTYFLPSLSVFLAAAFNKPVFVSLEAPAGDAFGFRALRSLVTVQAVATTCPAVAKVSSATLAAESPNLSPKKQITLNFLISKPAPKNNSNPKSQESNPLDCTSINQLGGYYKEEQTPSRF
jgi:hypothetical protein